MILALPTLVSVAAVAYGRGLVPGTNHWALLSVDKRGYLARNEAVFRTIPLPSYLRKAYSDDLDPRHTRAQPVPSR